MSVADRHELLFDVNYRNEVYGHVVKTDVSKLSLKISVDLSDEFSVCIGVAVRVALAEVEEGFEVFHVVFSHAPEYDFDDDVLSQMVESSFAAAEVGTLSNSVAESLRLEDFFDGL